MPTIYAIQFTEIYLSHFILLRVDVSLVCEKWVERHILRERTSSGSQGVPMLVPPCKLVRYASDQLRVLGSTAILCTLSKSDRVVVITWSSSGYTPVRSECPDVPSSSCLLIKMWQLTKAYGVTRNEPKIHVICYITISALSSSSHLPRKPSIYGKVIRRFNLLF